MAVPNTNTFSLQDVVDEINPTTDDLVDCISDATEGSYDTNYFSTPATSLLEFRNYGALSGFYTDLGTGFNSTVEEPTLQSDGKILVGGTFTSLNGNTRNRLVRLNSDGTEDTSFYSNLGTGFNSSVKRLALQSDGKVLAGGAFISLNGNTRKYLVRLNSDGTEDTSFYSNLGTGFDNSLSDIRVQSDGKILVGGFFTSLNGNTRNRLVRLNSDGTEDTSFYSNLGTGFNNAVTGIRVQSDGKILVGGSFIALNENTRNKLVRLNSNGTEDTGFYTNLDTGFNSTVYNTTIQSDGKILVGGTFTALNGNTRNRLVRLNSNGTEDTGFYTNLDTGFSSAVTSTSIQSDGKILVGGQFISLNGNTRNRLLRLNSNGTEDTGFYTNLGTGFNGYLEIGCISIQSDGKIVVGGAFTSLNGNTRNRLVRLNSDGTEDN
jgi:uncharacterized delta-60 repeat protein